MVPRTVFLAAVAFTMAWPAVAAARPQGDAKAARDDDDDDDDDDKPAKGKPDEPKPDAAKPDAAKPDAAKPDAAKPDAPKPDGDKPKPDAPGPDATAADAAKDAGAKSDAKAAKPDAKEDDDDDDDDDKGKAAPSKLVLEWGGKLQSDLRFRPQNVGVTPWYDGRGLIAGVDRNQNLFGLRMKGALGRVNVKADIDFILYGYSRDVHEFSDLTRRERIDPYRFDVQNLYLEVEDLFVKHFDLRIGQQIIDWGVGDQFNPTNNLNADDVEDVLLFGKQQGNFMVKADYWLNEDWSHELVLVPIFKPALLPRSAELGLARIDRIPVLDDAIRRRLLAENSAAADSPLGRNPTVVRTATPDLPDVSFQNMQFGYKIGGTVLDQDISLSYYRGRHDFPVPYRNHVSQDTTKRCNPNDASDCINSTLLNDVSLMYPRMHVYGLNLAGEVGWLKHISEKIFHSIGYRLEVALIVPDEVPHLTIQRDPISLGGFAVPADSNYLGSPAIYENRAFAKWTLGLDYTFNEHVYTNVQWVHGFPDEFGAGDFTHPGYVVGAADVPADLPIATKLGCALPEGQSFGSIVHVDANQCAHEYLRPRLADYLVWGFDFKGFQQKLLVRIFTIFALNGIREVSYDPNAGELVTTYHSMFTKDGFSAVLYPEINYNFGNGLDLGAGVLAQLGKEWTKFGDPATGGTIVWSRGRFQF